MTHNLQQKSKINYFERSIEQSSCQLIIATIKTEAVYSTAEFQFPNQNSTPCRPKSNTLHVSAGKDLLRRIEVHLSTSVLMLHDQQFFFFSTSHNRTLSDEARQTVSVFTDHLTDQTVPPWTSEVTDLSIHSRKSPPQLYRRVVRTRSKCIITQSKRAILAV